MQHAWLYYRISEENIPFGINRQRWEVNVKMERVKIIWAGVKCPWVGSNNRSI